MGRKVHGDTVSYDWELEDIIIPDNGGDGSSVLALLGAPGYLNQIVSWEIVENAAAMEIAKAADMSGATITRAVNLGVSPAVSRIALGTTFLRSTTAATVAAVLILYVADQRAEWPDAANAE